MPARNALLADIVPAAVYGRAYGFERAIDNLGASASAVNVVCLSLLLDEPQAGLIAPTASARSAIAVPTTPQPLAHGPSLAPKTASS